jgi:hypothetical protein
MMPLFCLSRWSCRRRNDGYFPWVTVSPHKGPFFLGTGLSFQCAHGGEFAGSLGPDPSGRFDGVV